MTGLIKDIGDLLYNDASINALTEGNIYYVSAPQMIESNSFIVYFINTTGIGKELSGETIYKEKNINIFINSKELSDIYTLLDKIYSVLETNVWYTEFIIDESPNWDEDNRIYIISMSISVRDFNDK